MTRHEDLALTWRPADPTDEHKARNLVRDAYVRWAPGASPEPWPTRADYLRALTLHRIDLLLSRNALAGLIVTERRDDNLWIETVAVRADLQARGLGRRLIAHAEALAEADDLPRLRLRINAVLQENVSRYQQLGFAVELTEATDAGPVLHMAKATGRSVTR
jgi:GNAT superfamily N-acetyltransferase